VEVRGQIGGIYTYESSETNHREMAAGDFVLDVPLAALETVCDLNEREQRGRLRRRRRHGGLDRRLADVDRDGSHGRLSLEPTGAANAFFTASMSYLTVRPERRTHGTLPCRVHFLSVWGHTRSASAVSVVVDQVVCGAMPY
jgi:hypothetical protein